MTFTLIVGLEVHLELKTQSKMFCGCSADHFGKPPNTQTCPVCLGLPGALPVPNKKAIDWTIKLGLAVDGQIPAVSRFDRKNYFYPDLPKGYQISQYDQPLVVGGEIAGIKLRRVHLEEDTGKLIHQGQWSLLDFNRSGVPLVEVVSEPVINSAQAAEKYLKELQRLVRVLGIADADMEKGQMRCEPTVNVQIEESGKTFYTPLVEIKNINSFRFVRQAIDYEMQRQVRKFSQTRVEKQVGNKTTRGWDEDKQITFWQRGKEEAADYRYFPEPDIPPLRFNREQIERIKKTLPELPIAKRQRWQQDYGLSEYQVEILIDRAAEFEQKTLKFKDLLPQDIANALINKRPIQRPKARVEIALGPVVKQIIDQNPAVVAEYKKGKTTVVEFLVGQAMKATKGQADATQAREELTRQLTAKSQELMF
jgi:aspartyl-tRNA(Asn)/glutamyl-tRNA(Gln) amidotransferase subunit B